jgi:hypothetical protein
MTTKAKNTPRKKSQKKLELNKETLRDLSLGTKTGDVRGGATAFCGTTGCKKY